MSLLAKVGSFNAPNATGNQAVTGVGFTPTFVFLISGITGTTGISAGPRLCLGWSAGSGKDAAFYASEVDNASVMDAQRAHRRDACIYRCDNSLNELEKASLVSFDSDGFTINWASCETAAPIAYLALGGDLVATAAAGPTLPTTGSPSGTTGAGFAPSAVLLGHAGSSITPSGVANDMFFGMGVATGAAERAAASLAQDDGNPNSDTRSTFSGSAVLVGSSFSGVDFVADLASLDSDGFTLSVSDNPASTVPTSYAAFAGVNVKAGSLSKKTSTGTQSVTGVGFTPKAGIFFSQYWGGDGGNALNCVGISDGTNEFGVGYASLDGNASAVAKCYWSTTKAIATVSNSTPPTVQGEADVQSWDADGFTLNWTTANAQASWIGYLLFGDPAAAAWTPRAVIL